MKKQIETTNQDIPLFRLTQAQANYIQEFNWIGEMAEFEKGQRELSIAVNSLALTYGEAELIQLDLEIVQSRMEDDLEMAMSFGDNPTGVVNQLRSVELLRHRMTAWLEDNRPETTQKKEG